MTLKKKEAISFKNFLKLIASFSEEKVADRSEKSSRCVSSVVGVYWNPCLIPNIKTMIDEH